MGCVGFKGIQWLRGHVVDTICTFFLWGGHCFISVCKSKYKNKIVIISTIDNLIKGGAGQAVQNLNMKFNFPIKTAL